MIKREDVYRIGRIGKPHGVCGEVSFMFDDDVFDRAGAEYLVLDVDGILVPFFIDEYRFKGSATALVSFAGIDSQERARELTGCDVYFPRGSSGEDGGQVSMAEIIGYELVDASDGTVVGTIRAVDDTTVNLLFEVDRADGREALVPVGEELVEEVDVAGRRVVMRLPEGLLDLDKL